MLKSCFSSKSHFHPASPTVRKLMKQADLHGRDKIAQFSIDGYQFIRTDPDIPLLVVACDQILCFASWINQSTHFLFTCHFSRESLYHVIYLFILLSVFSVHLLAYVLHHSHRWSSPSASLSPAPSSWCCRALWAPRTTRRTRWLHLWNPPSPPACSPLSVPRKSRAAWESERERERSGLCSVRWHECFTLNSRKVTRSEVGGIKSNSSCLADYSKNQHVLIDSAHFA